MDLKKMTHAQRADYLQTHADKIEEGEYFVSYGEEEMQQVQSDLADAAIKLESAKNEFEELKARHKALMEPFRRDYRTAIGNLRNQGEMVKGKLFLFADQEAKIMNFYDTHGDLIKSRRLKPEERQMTILNTKTA